MIRACFNYRGFPQKHSRLSTMGAVLDRPSAVQISRLLYETCTHALIGNWLRFCSLTVGTPSPPLRNIGLPVTG